MSHVFTIYFDGLCPLCSREIDHYRQLKTRVPFRYCDITSASFDATAEGVDPFAVHREFHVRTDEGVLLAGLPAFVAIWQRIEMRKWQLAARFACLPVVSPVLRAGYSVFARIRPLLPRRSRPDFGRDCSDSPYCEAPRSSRSTEV